MLESVRRAAGPFRCGRALLPIQKSSVLPTAMTPRQSALQPKGPKSGGWPRLFELGVRAASHVP